MNNEQVKALIDKGYTLNQIIDFNKMRDDLESAMADDTKEVVLSEGVEEADSEEVEEEVKVIEPSPVAYAEKENEFDRMFELMSKKMSEMEKRVQKVSTKFEEMTDKQVYKRTTDDILSEILAPNGESLKEE